MIIRNDERAVSKRANLKDGIGEIEIFDLTTPESIPSKLRLCSEMVIKPGCSIGEHKHINETEVYYILSGSGQLLDDGKYVDIKAGDTGITDGLSPHSIINTGTEDLKFIAIIAMN